MRPIFHTRPFAAVPWAVAILLAAGACSSGGPIYTFQPTDVPLRYALSSEGGNDIETPAGAQGATYSSQATMTMEVGNPTDAGTPFTITIESIVLETGGDFGGTTMDLSEDLAGKPFTGTMAPDGSLTFAEVPEFARDNLSISDMQRVVSALLFPLPPGGDMAIGSWAHRVTLPMGGGLEGESAYDGMISMAGDTVWNGIPATLFVSEGVVLMEGSGQPQGAPSEIDLVNEVEARTLYFWDHARGVLLAIEGSGEGGGDISTMGFSMPMAVYSQLSIQLVP
ncbi:MAG: hypothetical protein KJO44_02655 [Gemmatimonadetes bacterium]|nr:hypothetical protein [Gemmatimonadota bacterium]MBT8478772.1 hypothetical protein [Gemmatimonadota bacterium]NNK49825.1 hypothetical protein [Gemmatimonadota bacterium]